MESVKYTRIAAQAVSLAELVEARFQAGLEGPVHFRVELSAPEGPSTGGGTQALQHLKLVPKDGGPTIIFGSANTMRYAAEIRTFAHLAAVHRQRFKGARIPVDEARYGALVNEVTAFFEAMKMTVTSAELATSAPPVRRSARWTWVFPAAVVFILAAAALVYVLLRH